MKARFGIFLAAGFAVLATVASATGNFAVRLEAAAQQAARTPAGATIAVERIQLTQAAATGFGQIQPRPNVIAPGTPFHIYFEPQNLATRFENGAVRASMSIDILVRNERNETVAVRDNAWQLPISRVSTGPAPLTQVYGDLMLNHLTFADGRYQVVLRIHDDFNGSFVDRVIDVELRQAAVTPGPRLSQTQPQAQAQAQRPAR